MRQRVAARRIRHRVHAIHGEVDQDLLQLSAITDHHWNFREEVRTNLNAPSAGIAGQEIQSIRDDRIEIQRLHPCFSLARKVTNVADDFARASAIGTNLRDYLTQFVPPGVRGVQQACRIQQVCGGIDIVADRGQRLAQFMRDSRREFPHRRQTLQVFDAPVALLGAFLVGYVDCVPT